MKLRPRMENRAIHLCALWCVVAIAISLPCDDPNPIQEVAYVGAYEMAFPGAHVYSTVQPDKCRWRISAYRKDYVINLEFSDVNLTRGDSLNTCSEMITVYDGSDVTDGILADFCGMRNPSLVTSSRETLIVFHSNESLVASGRFRLKYRAVKERLNDDDSSQVLRLAFGGFIGAVAFVIICSGAIRRYKYGRTRPSVFFFFGRHRVDTTAMPVASGAARGSAVGRVAAGGRRRQQDARRSSSADWSQEEPERLTFRNRVTGFLHGIIFKLSPRRLDNESPTTDSSDCSSVHPSSRLPFRFGRLSNCPDAAAGAAQGRVGGGIGDAPDSVDARALPPFPADGHENFDYNAIPIGSFTSDPAAVKPPTYEDCVNSVSPLYLHSCGPAFYNPAFDLKDEVQGGAPQVFVPPPPYSEIGYPDNMGGSLLIRASGSDGQSFGPFFTDDLSGNERGHVNSSACIVTTGPDDSLTPVSTVQNVNSPSEQLSDPENACGGDAGISDSKNQHARDKTNPTKARDVDYPEAAEHPQGRLHSSREQSHFAAAPVDLFRRSGLVSLSASERENQRAAAEKEGQSEISGSGIARQVSDSDMSPRPRSVRSQVSSDQAGLTFGDPGDDIGYPEHVVQPTVTEPGFISHSTEATGQRNGTRTPLSPETSNRMLCIDDFEKENLEQEV